MAQPPWSQVSRELRRTYGLSQEDWAAWLEVSRKSVQRWEQGTAVPDDRVEALVVRFCEERGAMDAATVREILASSRRGVSPNAPIGRVADLDRLRALMASSRLVTVVGPGGVGKTTLALAAVEGDGVPVVRLEAVGEPALVIVAIADALGVRSTRGGRLRARVVDALADRPSVLLLDNFEHLLDAAPVVGDLLASCPALRVLLTSRAPLGLGEERLLTLEPLPCGGPSSPAVTLFSERAALSDPGADLDPAAVQLICERVDGLPLAIELAAARLRHLSLADLAARIDAALSMLHGLRAAIEWSVDLLTPGERQLFAQLSRFADGTTLDVIESVAGDVLDDLGALVDHSLVHRRGGRYRMLETVHDFAGGLAGDDEHERFVGWAIEFAAAHAGRMQGPEQRSAVLDVAAEYANLRAALASLIERRDDRALGLAISLAPFWDARSMLSEARRYLEPAIAASAPDGFGTAAARIWLGYFAAHQGDLAVAARSARAALAVFEPAGVDAGIGYALMVQAFVATEEERLDVAERLWLECAAAFRRVGDTWGLVRPLNNLGELVRARGDASAALVLHDEALQLCRSLGEVGSLPAVLSALAQAALDVGDGARAVAAASEALAVAADLDNLVGQATALEALGRAAFERGDVDGAVGLWGRAATARRQIDLPIEARDRRRHEAQLAAAREQLGEADFAELYGAT